MKKNVNVLESKTNSRRSSRESLVDRNDYDVVDGGCKASQPMIISNCSYKDTTKWQHRIATP
jgi:hypothetical protein